MQIRRRIYQVFSKKPRPIYSSRSLSSQSSSSSVSSSDSFNTDSSDKQKKHKIRYLKYLKKKKVESIKITTEVFARSKNRRKNYTTRRNEGNVNKIKKMWKRNRMQLKVQVIRENPTLARKISQSNPTQFKNTLKCCDSRSKVNIFDLHQNLGQVHR